MYKYCCVCNSKFKKTYIDIKDEKYIPDIDSLSCLLSFILKSEGNSIFSSNIKADIFNKGGEDRSKSSYEDLFEEWLKENNIPYHYEPYAFTLPSGIIYVPDFYLPKQKIYIEIKGRWYPGAFNKFKLFERKSGCTIFLIHSHIINMIKKGSKE